MARRTGQQVLAKWARRIQENQEDTLAAIDRVEESPGKAAARKKATWKARTMASADKWEKNTGAVELQDWSGPMKKKGVPRAIEGAQLAAADAKTQQTFDALMEYTEMVKKTVRAMPNATDAERRARRDKAEELMKKFKKPM